MITMANTAGGGWLGADGENYLTGVDGLLNQGFFSSEGKLTYWPAGYPLLIWPFAAISITKFLYGLSLVQSLFFAYSTYFVSKSIQKNSLGYLAFTVSFFISFNPTLSLGSLAIGYETPVASCLLIALGIAINSQKVEVSRKNIISAMAIGAILSLASFMQPRFILVSAIFIFIWVIYFKPRSTQIKLAAAAGIMLMVLPTVLIARNAEAVGKATISTNLGITMSLGAGDETLGGYGRIGPAVPCDSNEAGGVTSDNQTVVCILKWYATNPIKTMHLAVNKSLYFWSPWSGPVAEGTMARNPWLKISPVQNMIKSTDGATFVLGTFGKSISYLWILGQIIFLFWGFFAISKIGRREKFIACLIFSPVLLSWLITLGTIGDHRFRIPTMGLSLILQVAGILELRKKFVKAL
jgi:hypothetical protein